MCTTALEAAQPWRESNPYDIATAQPLKLGFCARTQDGYLGGVPETAAPEIMDLAAKRIGDGLGQDGFPDRAVEVLRRSGVAAWVNCVGHVTVDVRPPIARMRCWC